MQEEKSIIKKEKKISKMFESRSGCFFSGIYVANGDGTENIGEF